MSAIHHAAATAGGLLIPVSVGELVDKITILEIKQARMTNPVQLRNVGFEHAALSQCLQGQITCTAKLQALRKMLRVVNECLWNIEERIRECELRGDFGPVFVQLARAVYLTNDRRAALKREVNIRCASELIEEKSYPTRSGSGCSEWSGISPDQGGGASGCNTIVVPSS